MAERVEQFVVPSAVHMRTANAKERGQLERQILAENLPVVVICENVRPEHRDQVLALCEAALVLGLRLDRKLGDCDHTSNAIASPQYGAVTLGLRQSVIYCSHVGNQCIQEKLSGLPE